jgi:hypothetical protein
LYKGLGSFREYILVDSKSVQLEHFVKNEGGVWTIRKYERIEDSLIMLTTGITLSLEEIYEETEFPKLIY